MTSNYDDGNFDTNNDGFPLPEHSWLENAFSNPNAFSAELLDDVLTLDRAQLEAYGFDTADESELEAARAFFLSYMQPEVPETEKYTCPDCGTISTIADEFCPHCQESPRTLLDMTEEEIDEAQNTIFFEINGMPYPVIVVNMMTLGRCDERLYSNVPNIDLSPFGAHEKGVSRHHIAIRRDGFRLYVSDLGSTNGTLLNGQRLKPDTDYQLHPDDELFLSYLKITIRA